MYLGKFADSPEVLSQLIAYTTVNASNPISLAGVYAAVAGSKRALLPNSLPVAIGPRLQRKAANSSRAYSLRRLAATLARLMTTWI